MTSHKTMVGKVDPEVLSFTVGKDLELDGVLAEVDCIGSAAHASMLAAAPFRPPVITAGERDRIIRELVDVIRRVRAGRFRISERDQDVHLAIERILTRKLGDTGKKIHTARSRNDQVAVDVRLYAKSRLLDVMDEALSLTEALLAFGRKHADVPMVGRTHMVPAMPSSVGLWATAHAESLLDDMDLARAAYAQNNRCPLGSAAGYGVPVAIDRALTASLLGFSAPVHNVLYAGNARGKCESVILACLTQIMVSLSRLVSDLMFFAMPEFGYFSLPPDMCTGSSIMPQKQNPDVLELVRAKASKVMACADLVTNVVKALPSGYSRDLQETKEPFLEGLQTGLACLRVLARLVPGVSVHRSALARGFTPEVFAADRALEMVAKGASFRDAYHHVKAHLEELEGTDPGTAVRAKTHAGAPAGLDFRSYRDRTARLKKFVMTERDAYHTAISKLLGVAYPKMEA